MILSIPIKIRQQNSLSGLFIFWQTRTLRVLNYNFDRVRRVGMGWGGEGRDVVVGVALSCTGSRDVKKCPSVEKKMKFPLGRGLNFHKNVL